MKFKNILSQIFNGLKKISYQWQIYRDKSFASSILKFFPKNFLLVIFLICSFIIIFNEYAANNNSVIYRNNHLYSSNVGAIYKEPIEFSLDRKNVDQDFDILSIKFATYDRINDSDYTLSVMDKNNVVYETNFNTKKFGDNEYEDFYLNDTIDSKRLKDYTVKISPIKTDTSNNITVLCNEENGDIAVAYKVSKSPLNISTFIIIGMIILFFILMKIVNERKIIHEKFLILALIFIALATILTPPYQVLDERLHYLRTLQLSQYNFSKTPSENLGSREIIVPDNLDDVNYSRAEATDAVTDVGLIGDSMVEGRNIEKRYNSSIGGSAVMVAYLLPSIILRLVDCFTNSPLVLFYTGRLVCLGINFLLTYYAIKLTPKFKNTMLIVALMPMSIQSMISYSYDGLLNACILLFIATCLKMIYDKENKINKRYLSISVIMLFMIISIKLPYALLGVLYFFIPSYKFNNSVKKTASIFIVLFATYLSTLLLSKVMSIGALTTSVVSNSGNEQSNFTYILNNPLEIFSIAKNTFKEKIVFYIDSLVGYFGYFSIKMHTIFQYAYLIMAGGLILTEESNFKKKERIFYFLIVLTVIAGIFGALYFAWSGYQLSYVEGVQGRYFIPLILPTIMIFSFRKKILTIKNSTIFSFIDIVLLNYIILLLVYNF